MKFVRVFLREVVESRGRAEDEVKSGRARLEPGASELGMAASPPGDQPNRQSPKQQRPYTSTADDLRLPILFARDPAADLLPYLGMQRFVGCASSWALGSCGSQTGQRAKTGEPLSSMHFRFGTRRCSLRPFGVFVDVSGQKHQKFIEDDAQK